MQGLLDAATAYAIRDRFPRYGGLYAFVSTWKPRLGCYGRRIIYVNSAHTHNLNIGLHKEHGIVPFIGIKKIAAPPAGAMAATGDPCRRWPDAVPETSLIRPKIGGPDLMG